MADEYITGGTIFYRVSDKDTDSVNVRDTTLHTNYGDLSDGNSPALLIKAGNDSSLALMDFKVPKQPTFGGTHELLGLDLNFTTIAPWNHTATAAQSTVQGSAPLPVCNIFLMKEKEIIDYEGDVSIVANDGTQYAKHVNAGTTFENADVAAFLSYASDESTFFSLGEDFSGSSDIGDDLWKYTRRGKVMSGLQPYLTPYNASKHYIVYEGLYLDFPPLQPISTTVMSGLYGSEVPGFGRGIKIEPASGDTDSLPPENWHPKVKDGVKQGFWEHPVVESTIAASPAGLFVGADSIGAYAASKMTQPAPVQATTGGIDYDFINRNTSTPTLRPPQVAGKETFATKAGRWARGLGKLSMIAMPVVGSYLAVKAGEAKKEEYKEAYESGDWSSVKRPYFEPMWKNKDIKNVIEYYKEYQDYEITERDETACTLTSTWWDKIKEVRDYPKPEQGAGGTAAEGTGQSYGSKEDMLAKSSINFSQEHTLNGGNMRMQCYHDLDLSSPANAQLDFNFGSPLNPMQQDIFCCKYNIPQPARIFQNGDGYSNGNVEPPAKYEISFKMNVTDMPQQYSATTGTTPASSQILFRRGFAVTFSSKKPKDDDSFNDYIQRHGPEATDIAWGSDITGFVIHNPIDLPGSIYSGLELLPLAQIFTDGGKNPKKGIVQRGVREDGIYTNDLKLMTSQSTPSGPIIPPATWLEYKLTTDLHGASGTSEKKHGRFQLSIYHAGSGELLDVQKEGGDWEGPVCLASCKDAGWRENLSADSDHNSPLSDDWLPHMTFWVINHRYNSGSQFNLGGYSALASSSYTHDSLSSAMIDVEVDRDDPPSETHNSPYFLGKTSVHIDEIMIKNAEAKKVNWSINDGNKGNVVLENTINQPHKLNIRPSNEPSWFRTAGVDNNVFDVTPTVMSLGFETTDNLVGQEQFTDATCSTADGNAIIEHDANALIIAGLPVSGAGIPAGAIIATKTDSTHFDISPDLATATADPITCTFGSPKFLLFNDFNALEKVAAPFADSTMKAGFQDETTYKMGDFVDAYMTQTTDIGIDVANVVDTTHTAGYRQADTVVRFNQASCVLDHTDGDGKTVTYPTNANIVVGMPVGGNVAIRDGTYVASINSTESCELSQAPTGSATVTLTFGTAGIEHTSHGRAEGDRVSFWNYSGATLLNEISYYVRLLGTPNTTEGSGSTTWNANHFYLSNDLETPLVKVIPNVADTSMQYSVLESASGGGVDKLLAVSDASGVLKVGDIITLGQGAGQPADAGEDLSGNAWVEHMEVTAINGSSPFGITIKRDISLGARGAQQPLTAPANPNSIFKVGKSQFTNLTIGDDEDYDIITGSDENDAFDKNRTTSDKCYVEGFSQKGFLQIENAFTNWDKRENIYASTRITGLGAKEDGPDGAKSISQDVAKIMVADSSVLGFEEDEKYVIYSYGSLKATAFDISNDSADASVAAIVTIYEKDKDSITVIRDTSERWDLAQTASHTGTYLDVLLTEARLPKLFISPWRYWLYIQMDTMDTISQPATRGYGSVMPVAPPQPTNTGFDLGVTFNERRFYVNTSGETTYNDLRSFEITQLPRDIPYETNTDFGYGAYDSETQSGGHLSAFKPMFGSNRISIDGVRTGRPPSEGQTLSLLIQATANNTIDSEMHIWSGDFDAAESGTPSAGNKPKAIPQLLAKYVDRSPAKPGLTVNPNENIPLFPEFMFATGDDDLWYGYIIVDNAEITDKYHGIVAYTPLNENMEEPWLGKRDNYRGGGSNTWKQTKLYGNRESIGNDEFTTYLKYPILYATTDGVYSSDAQSSRPFQTMEGLAGRAMDTRGTANYLSMPYRASYTPWAAGIATSKGCSVVIHVTSGDASADADILSLTTSATNKPINISVSSAKVVAKVYDEDGNYVQLTSTTSLPRDGELPTCIILTVDPDITTGNVKLFLNGVLEASSDSAAAATNNATRWGITKTVLTNGSNTTQLELGKFDGIYEEFIMYSHVIYPVVLGEGGMESMILEKPLEEVANDTKGYPLTYNARLFVFDYHNLRGDAVSHSSQVSWKKASFNIDGT